MLRSGDSGARTTRKSVRPKSVTHVLGTLCNPCLRAGPRLSGAPGEIRTPDPLLRSRLSTFIKTCRSERKAGENQQVVTKADKPLPPSSSPLSRLFAPICHTSYYVFMTAEHM